MRFLVLNTNVYYYNKAKISGLDPCGQLAFMNETFSSLGPQEKVFIHLITYLKGLRVDLVILGKNLNFSWYNISKRFKFIFFIYLYFFVHIYLSVCLSIYLIIHPSIGLSIQLSIYLSSMDLSMF